MMSLGIALGEELAFPQSIPIPDLWSFSGSNTNLPLITRQIVCVFFMSSKGLASSNTVQLIENHWVR